MANLGAPTKRTHTWETVRKARRKANFFRPTDEEFSLGYPYCDSPMCGISEPTAEPGMECDIPGCTGTFRIPTPPEIPNE